MYKTGFNFSLRKTPNYFKLTDEYFVLFKNSLTENKIKNLNSHFKQYEKNGYVTYKNYFKSMKSILDLDVTSKEYKNHCNNNKNNLIQLNNFNDNESVDSEYSSIENDKNDKNEKNFIFDEIYDLIFERFREMKCIIKNNRNVFYLTDFKKENYISTYNLLCALTIFIQTNFENKLKLLFYLTDIDEDGFLNKKEIENMIITINLLFGEEVNAINLNSSILSQSLVNIRVKNILYDLLYNSGGLCDKLAEEHNYITFGILYESIKKIKNYKYKIIPCFVNFKDCLYSYKKEKMINVRDKHKQDFINISSTLVLEQNKVINEDNFKKFSFSNLNQIIQPIKIDKNQSNFKSKGKRYQTMPKKYAKIFKHDLKNVTSLLKSDKSLKELIKNSTILNEKIENMKLKTIKQNRGNKIYQYAFQANFSDIRNIEVEPGIIKFISNETQKNDENNKNNRIGEKSPEVRRKHGYNNGNQNKNLNLFDSLNKIIGNNHEENNRNASKHITNRIGGKIFKMKSFQPQLAHSLSSKNVMNFYNKIAQKEDTNSNHIIKKKNIIKLTNNNYNNNERYKTFEEIMQEISGLEKKFNFESVNNVNDEMLKEYKEFQYEINQYKRNSLINNDKVAEPFYVHKYRTFETIRNKKKEQSKSS